MYCAVGSLMVPSWEKITDLKTVHFTHSITVAILAQGVCTLPSLTSWVSVLVFTSRGAIPETTCQHFPLGNSAHVSRESHALGGLVLLFAQHRLVL